jgi:hypothetical protein
MIVRGVRLALGVPELPKVYVEIPYHPEITFRIIADTMVTGHHVVSVPVLDLVPGHSR